MRVAVVLCAVLASPVCWAGQAGPPSLSPPAENGQTPPPAAAPPAPAWLPRDGADVVALNKLSAKTLTLTLTVGQAARFGALTIALRACYVRPADQPADAAAWLDITNPKPGAPQFQGWMLSSDPAVSSLEDPIYDVRLLGCR
jgi:hypothetical protein